MTLFRTGRHMTGLFIRPHFVDIHLKSGDSIPQNRSSSLNFERKGKLFVLEYPMRTQFTLSLTFLACTLLSTAQVDLDGMSASKRLRVAEEEQIASEQDPQFQDLMTAGVDYFENREYEKAISKFEAAGERRPINVYPPVMIEDVKLAMANLVEEEVVEEPEMEEEKPEEPELTAEERVEQMYQAELAKVYKDMPPPPKKEQPEKIEEPIQKDAEGLIILDEVVEEEVEVIEIEEAATQTEVTKEEPVVIKKETELVIEEDLEEKSLEEKQEELAASYPDGVTEEVFTEGNRTITKRIVVKDGLGNEYRKVKHGWGGVFYFKNGVSISERVWLQDTAQR
jgi:hypothetical protein